MKIYLLLMLCLSFGLQAAEYQVNYDESSITFSGVHAGNEFEGVFEKWQADIQFDLQDLDKSHFSAVFQSKSAKTGNKLYDGTLPQADWFDSKNYPEARFDSTGFSKNTDGSYQVSGNLTIRDISQPVDFRFEVSDQSLSIISALTIDRLAYDIGKKSDPVAEWVSQEIAVKLNIMTSLIP